MPSSLCLNKNAAQFSEAFLTSKDKCHLPLLLKLTVRAWGDGSAGELPISQARGLEVGHPGHI